jgi:hypothetical protein
MLRIYSVHFRKRKSTVKEDRMGILSRWRKKRRDAQQAKKEGLEEVWQAQRDIAYANRVIERHKRPSPQAQAIKFAQKHVGIREVGNNAGPKIEQWQKLVETFPGEMRGAPWCGAFMFAVLKHVGVKGLSWRLRYVPYIVEDAKLGRNGMKQLVAWNDRRPGDLVIFNFDGGVVDHVGMYVRDNPDGTIATIEGNTSSGSAGSQANGGGVFARSRARAIVSYLVRPRYA